MPPVQVKAVTIITVFEAREMVLEGFRELGVRGYSSSHIQGVGLHGQKRNDLDEAENHLFVIVASEALAARLLAWVDERLLLQYPTIAFSVDAAAVAGRAIA